MEPVSLGAVQWHEIEGQWQTLVREGFHAAYLGIGEAYVGVGDVDAKIAAMSVYKDALRVWAAWAGSQIVGLVAGKVAQDRLVIYDLFVAIACRRQGIGRRLIELAIRDSQVSAVAAEVNRENVASQALFEALDFQRALVSQWFVLQVPRADQHLSL